LAGALAFGVELRLLQQSKDAESYAVHRLVGEVRRGEIPLQQRRAWVDTVSSRVGDWFQEKRQDFSQLPLFESEIDHLKKWQENAAQFAPSHASRLMWLQAYPAYHRGRYLEARSYVIKAQEIFDELGGTDQELEANLLNDRAFTNKLLGETQSVLSDNFGALEIRRRLFGEQHAEVASSLSNIGQSYGELGEWQCALEYSLQALSMRRSLFGEPDRSVAASMIEVGRCYGHQGDIQAAVRSVEHALAMLEHLFGYRHPLVASALGNLGHWHQEKGDFDRALGNSKRALIILRELFGEQHPAIATVLNNIGMSYKKKGDREQAQQFLSEALAMSRDLLGERHPETSVPLANIGSFYRAEGDLRKALEYSKSALTIRYELLGKQHPWTVRVAGDVASTLMQLNLLQDAYTLVTSFLADGRVRGRERDKLKQIEHELLSKTMRAGFRQPPRVGKRNAKKKRR